jgi:hypothetical protein
VQNMKKQLKKIIHPYKGQDKKVNKVTTFAVDESGDPTFYDKKGRFVAGKNGCSPILIMGCIYTGSPESVRNAVLNARKTIINDPLVAPFIRKNRLNKFFFHAKEDRPEVRKYFFEVIKDLNFKARFVVARKNEQVFTKRHLRKESIFYDDMITKLFTNILYKSEDNIIYFSKRGSRLRREPLNDAIQKSINLFESKSDYIIENKPEIFVQVPSDEPLLDIVDYINWSIYRAYTSTEPGSDAYINFILEKVKLIYDIYDFNLENWEDRFYNHKTNKFDVKKISPVGLGSGISSLPHRDGGLSSLQD